MFLLPLVLILNNINLLRNKTKIKMTDFEFLAQSVFDKLHVEVHWNNKSRWLLNIDYAVHVKIIKTEILEKYTYPESRYGILEALKIEYITYFSEPRNSPNGINDKLFKNIIDFVNEKIEKEEQLLLNKPSQNLPNEFSDNPIIKSETSESIKVEQGLETSELDKKNTEEETINVMKIIEEYLEPTENYFRLTDSYIKIKEYLFCYFTNGTFPEEMTIIHLNRINKKAFAYILYKLYKKINTTNSNLPYEYLLFGKQYISIFLNTTLTKEKMSSCQLFKYYTTETPLISKTH
jgi:hypothetical protein